MKSVIDVYGDIAKNNPPWTPEEEIEFTKKWFNNDRDKWVNEAMKHNMALVFKVFNKMSFNRNNEDLFQKVVIAMVDALRKYDPKKGVRVCTWIMNPIRWAIHRSRDAYNKEGMISDEISAKNHRYNLGLTTVSIDNPVSNSDGDKSETIGNTISISNVNVNYVNLYGLKNESEIHDENEIKDGVSELVSQIGNILNEKEIVVIKGLLSGRNMAEISTEMSVSRVRISQISKNAFEKIRRSSIGMKLKGLI